MGSIDKRIAELQRCLVRTTEPSEAYLQLKAVVKELSDLKASASVHYCARRRVEGGNIPRRLLGPGYTHGDLWRLAVSRCAEAGTLPVEMTEACIGVLRDRGDRAGKDPDSVVEWEQNVS